MRTLTFDAQERQKVKPADTSAGVIQGYIISD